MISDIFWLQYAISLAAVLTRYALAGDLKTKGFNSEMQVQGFLPNMLLAVMPVLNTIAFIAIVDYYVKMVYERYKR